MSARTRLNTGRKIPRPIAGFAFGGRDEHRLVRQSPRQPTGVVVAETEEHDEVERLRPRHHAVHQRRAGRPLCLEPRRFVGHRVEVVEHPLGVPAERLDAPFVGHREAVHVEAVDPLGPRLQIRCAS